MELSVVDIDSVARSSIWVLSDSAGNRLACPNYIELLAEARGSSIDREWLSRLIGRAYGANLVYLTIILRLVPTQTDCLSTILTDVVDNKGWIRG